MIVGMNSEWGVGRREGLFILAIGGQNLISHNLVSSSDTDFVVLSPLYSKN